MDPLLKPDLAKFLLERASFAQDPLLGEMQAMASARRFPIVGPEVGRLLAQVTRMLSARRVFELGSGFGYSTLFFARHLEPGGEVFHTDTSAENQELARGFLGRAEVLDRVRFLRGDACELIDQTEGLFDIVFCDVDKEAYPLAYERMHKRVRKGGAVIVDNLLWSGRVADPHDNAPSTQGIREFIRKMWSNDDYLSSLLPIRDGVGLSIKIR